MDASNANNINWPMIMGVIIALGASGLIILAWAVGMFCRYHLRKSEDDKKFYRYLYETQLQDRANESSLMLADRKHERQSLATIIKYTNQLGAQMVNALLEQIQAGNSLIKQDGRYYIETLDGQSYDAQNDCNMSLPEIEAMRQLQASTLPQ